MARLGKGLRWLGRGAAIADQVDAAVAAALENVATIETGDIVSMGHDGARTGFLPCDGAAVSRTTYADLFAVIGTGYGAGNGTTTFNVPDLRGRAPQGADGTDAIGAEVGADFPMSDGITASELTNVFTPGTDSFAYRATADGDNRGPRLALHFMIKT